MKTSTTLVGMTIILLLLALPVGAADYTLGIFGNANEDDEINMVDVTYTELIIMERVDETQLADGKYDGEIDILDVTQIELIILGREKELTLIDSADRIVTVEKPVEKVVIDMLATVEAITLLGAEDRVVGRCPYVNEILFPEIIELPVITGPGGYDVYYETVFELDPDILLSWNAPFPGLDDVVNTLEPEITVVALNFHEPETMIEDIRKLRYVLNTKEEGDAFIAFYEGVINDITEETAGLTDEEKPEIFLKFPGWTPEQLGTFNDKAPGVRYQFEVVGGINIAADLPGFGFVSDVDSEWLIDQNPDIVVANIWNVYNPGAFGYEVDTTSVAIATREQIMAMPAFAGGKAVEDGEVYLYESEFGNTPRIIVGIAYWAKWFHPELFDDLDPQEIHQQYLTDFLGIDYNLDEQGVFVYPEP